MKKNSIIVLAFLAFIFSACSFSTANISDLKFGKNDQASPSVTSFNVGEKIFAVATVANAMGKHKLKYQLKYENVPGKAKGEPGLKSDIDIDGNSEAFFSFSSDLPGDYSVEVTLVDEQDKELGKKSGTIKITGSAPAAPKKDDAVDDTEE